MSGDGYFGGFTDQLADEVLREAAGRPLEDIIVSEPVTLARLRELLPAIPPPRTLHCHTSVTAALAAAAPPREPGPLDFMNLGRIGDLCGIPVYEDPEMMPGAWEIREGAQGGKGGKLVTFGVLRSAQ